MEEIMKRWLVTVLATVISANVLGAELRILTVVPSWVDGNVDTKTVRIEEVGLPHGSDLPFYDGETRTYHALVPEGHDVTMWSYQEYSQANLLNAIENGHFKYTKVTDPVDEFVWASMPAENQFLAVHLDWLKYDLKYDGNGATSGTPAERRNIVYTNSYNLSAKPVRTGYSFQKWIISGQTPEVAFADSARITDGGAFGLTYTNKSVTLKAQWKANEYNVTFDANGGKFSDGTTCKTQKYTYGQAYGSTPAYPDPPGGFLPDGNCWTNAQGQVVDLTQPVLVSANHTLYAKWKSVGALRIDAVKHSDETGAEGAVTGSGSYSYGATCNLQATANPGSHFVKWTKGATGGASVSTDAVYSFVVKEAATYYAHFALNVYTVTFKYKDASGRDVSDSQAVKYGQAATPPTVQDYPHHRFNAWDTSDYKSVKGDLVVNAKYDSTVLTVRFDLNGGEQVSPEYLDYDLGDKYGILPVPLRTGYAWDGKWWTRASGGEPITAESEVTMTGTQTLYPHWTANRYTLTLDPNYEGGPAPTTSEVTYDSYYPTLAEVTRTGYKFGGWFTGRESGEKVTTSVKVTTAADHSLYAHWTANTYWIYLNAKGGTGAPSSIQVTYDSRYSGLTNPTREGYTFLGWYTEETGGTRVQNGERVQITQTTNLYAHWAAKTYTVTFDPRGGTVSETSRVVTYDAKYGALPQPVRKGYEFIGWFTAATGGSPVDGEENVRITSDTVFYARWTAHQYDVFFIGNGGSGSMSSRRFTWDVAQQLAQNTFKRTGYAFTGWAVTATSEKLYEDQQIVSNLTESASCQLFAVWNPNAYTIRFDANGGTGEGMPDLAAHYDVELTLPKNTYVNGNRKFSGWDGSDGRVFGNGAVVSNLTDTADGVYVLKARWANTYQIEFDGNGSTAGAMPPMTVDAATTVALDANRYTRTGYTYLGWATNEARAAAWKTDFSDGQKVSKLAPVGETKRLFAVWTNNLYRVRFYPNGGAGTVTEKTCAYDVAFELPDGETFTREGYELTGWLTDPTQESGFSAGESVSNLTDQAGAVVSLFAQWSRKGVDLGAYSVAADCDKAGSDGRVPIRLIPGEDCTTITNEPSLPGPNNQCIKLSPTTNGMASAELMTEELHGKGQLRYRYRVKIAFPGYLSQFQVVAGESQNRETTILEKNSSVDWEEGIGIYEKQTDGPEIVTWRLITWDNTKYDDFAYIDDIAWIPENPDLGTVGVTFRRNDGTPAPADIVTNVTLDAGKPIGALPVLADEDWLGWSTTAGGAAIDATWIVPATDTQLYALWKTSEHPVPGPGDAPTIGGFAAAADGFSLSCTSDNRFDYRLLSTMSLVAPIKWEPTGEPMQGTGEALNFTIPVESTDPMKFFRVEVLQRGTK